MIISLKRSIIYSFIISFHSYVNVFFRVSTCGSIMRTPALPLVCKECMVDFPFTVRANSRRNETLENGTRYVLIERRFKAIPNHAILCY